MRSETERSDHGGHGLEGDNDPSGSDHAPVSAPQIYNATLCGGDSRGRGLLLRHGSHAVVGNAIFAGFAGGIEVRDGGDLRLPGAGGAEPGSAGESTVRTMDAAGCDGGSPLPMSGAATPPDDGFFDASANFHGAVRDGQDDWARAAWTRWD